MSMIQKSNLRFEVAFLFLFTEFIYTMGGYNPKESHNIENLGKYYFCLHYVPVTIGCHFFLERSLLQRHK